MRKFLSKISILVLAAMLMFPVASWADAGDPVEVPGSTEITTLGTVTTGNVDAIINGPVFSETGAKWYKLGEITVVSNEHVIFECYGANSSGVANGVWERLYFSSYFGSPLGIVESHGYGSANNLPTFYYKAGTGLYEIYMHTSATWSGHLKLISDDGWTWDSTPTTGVSDPSGTAFTNWMQVWSPLYLGTGTGVSEFSIDGTFAGNSDDAVPTEKAAKTYADTKIPKSIGTAKGDTIGYSATETPVRVAIGTDGYVATADSGEAAGWKWAEAAGGIDDAIAGDIAVVSTTAGCSCGTSWVQRLAYRVPRDGTYRIRVGAKNDSTNTSYHNYAKLYINDCCVVAGNVG